MPIGKKAAIDYLKNWREPRLIAGVLFLILLIASAHIKLETPISSLSISLQTVVLGLTCRLLHPLDSFKVIAGYTLLGALGFDVFSAVEEGLSFYTHRYAGFLIGFLVLPLYFHRFKRVSSTCLQDLFFLFIGMHGVIIICGILRMEYPHYSTTSIINVITALAPAAILKSVFLAIVIRILQVVPGWFRLKSKLNQ